MNKYADVFRNQLLEAGLNAEELTRENITAFKVLQQLKSGPMATLLFTLEDNIMDIHLMNYISIDDASKLNEYMFLINEINCQNRFITFYVMQQKAVALKLAFTIMDEFKPDLAIAYALLLISAADEAFEKFIHIEEQGNSA